MPKISRTAKFRKTASRQESARTAKALQQAASTKIKPSESAIDIGKDNVAANKVASQLIENKGGRKSDAEQTTASLSRGQRKRLAKRQQYLRKEQMIISSLRLKHQEEQKKRIDGLDAIKEALLETVREGKSSEGQGWEEEAKPNLLKSNKSRQKLLEKEVTQMNLVMQHPAFQADPFATIREHLKNTISKDVEKHKKQVSVHLRERKEKQEHKKAIKKESGAKKKRKKFKATRSKSR